MSIFLNILATLSLLWIVGGLMITFNQMDFMSSSYGIDPVRVMVLGMGALILWRIWC